LSLVNCTRPQPRRRASWIAQVPAVAILPDLIGGDQRDDRRDVVGDSPSDDKLSAEVAVFLTLFRLTGPSQA
jgi:hypothetical protein